MSRGKAPTKICFVLMPFSGTRRPKMSAAQWTEVFENTFKPAIESAGYLCTRSPLHTGNFVKGIIEFIDSADIVLADFTGQKANVAYELGIRHSRKRGTILVAQDIADIPSDLKSYSFQIYGWTTAQERSKFQADIKRIIKKIEKDHDRSDSPVFDFLGVPSPQSPSAIAIRPANTVFMNAEPSDLAHPAAFALVQIMNGGPFAPRVRCWMRFFRQDGSEVFASEMPGRWSGAQEPLTVVSVPSKEGMRLVTVPDPSKVPAGYVTDLAIKEEDSVAVAVKGTDGTCWGWTPESYRYGWQHPSWQLPLEPLRIRVRVVANGVEYLQRVDLDTAAPLSDFRTRMPDTGEAASEIPLTRDIEPETPQLPERTDIDRLY